jgi:hypothetical protein
VAATSSSGWRLIHDPSPTGSRKLLPESGTNFKPFKMWPVFATVWQESQDKKEERGTHFIPILLLRFHRPPRMTIGLSIRGPSNSIVVL